MSDHAGPATRLRDEAKKVFAAGVAAAAPGLALKRCLTVESGALRIGIPTDAETAHSKPWSRVHVVAFGKAAIPMAQAALEVVPSEMLSSAPTVVTSYENATPTRGLDVHGAAHPLPDANGQAAADLIARVATDAQQGELVLALISGGASALLPLPPQTVPLADKIATTQLLLACGADIGEINTVRKHLSQLKGGGLARLAAPADMHALILSDVIGDDLSTVASGPTVPDDTTFAQALNVFARRNRVQDLPASVRDHLERGCAGEIPETPGSDQPFFANTVNTLIGSNRISLDASISSAESLGYEVQVHSRTLQGEARDAAKALCLACAALPPGRHALVAGGETTVTLRGKGRGGRNQELALAFAVDAELAQLPGGWAFLSGGTDGIDGPTDAAGGLVDDRTLARIRRAGGNPQALLDDNDAYAALSSSDDLLMTGATGTNVADLQILLVDR